MADSSKQDSGSPANVLGLTSATCKYDTWNGKGELRLRMKTRLLISWPSSREVMLSDLSGPNVFFFFNLFLWEDNYFIILCWFLPYINMNQPLIYVCPLPVEPLSHFWLHPTPLGCHKALGLSSLCQTANLHWLSHFTFGNVYVSVSGRGSQNFQNDRKWEKDLTSYCWLRRWKGPQAKECG